MLFKIYSYRKSVSLSSSYGPLEIDFFKCPHFSPFYNALVYYQNHFAEISFRRKFVGTFDRWYNCLSNVKCYDYSKCYEGENKLSNKKKIRLNSWNRLRHKIGSIQRWPKKFRVSTFSIYKSNANRRNYILSPLKI